MSSPDVTPVAARRYWPWVLLRALPAIAVAVVITFSADHSSVLGLAGFGALALVSGLAVALGGLTAVRTPGIRPIMIAQGAIGVVAGTVALARTGGGLPFLIFLIGAWAVLTGFLELYCGLRTRSRDDSSRDWIFGGALTVVFAVVSLLIPADLSQPFMGPDSVERALTGSVVVVGLIGAYGAVLGIYLVIAGLSLKWVDRSAAAPAAESGN